MSKASPRSRFNVQGMGAERHPARNADPPAIENAGEML